MASRKYRRIVLFRRFLYPYLRVSRPLQQRLTQAPSGPAAEHHLRLQRHLSRGQRINAEYGKPVLVRFENHLDENPLVLDRQDFGAPDWSSLTRLHNGHTAPESDGNPHYTMKYGPKSHGYLPKMFVVDFTRYQDGSPTTKGDVIYLTNVMKMPDGRMWSTSSRASADPDYKVPVMRIVIGDNALDDSRIPTQMRPLPPLPSNWKCMLDNRLIFEVKRGSGDLLLALRRCGVGGWAPAGGRGSVRLRSAVPRAPGVR
jgi:hypothetical protein